MRSISPIASTGYPAGAPWRSRGEALRITMERLEACTAEAADLRTRLEELAERAESLLRESLERGNRLR